MWVEETKNGKFRAVERYTDYLTGKTKKVSVTMAKNTAQSRKVAQAALSEKIMGAYQQPKEKKDVRLDELVEAYREDQELTVKKSTFGRNYFACNTIMGILGESTLVSRLTAKYVREKMLATGKGAGTLNEHLARFKALMRWGYHNDLIDNISFLDKLELFKDIPHRQKIQDKYLEADELKTLLATMTVDTWRLLTQFLALSGLRFGESAALLESDIDMDSRLIHVTKTYDYINDEVTTPKTLCSIRDVYMQDELKEVCKKMRVCMLQQRIFNGYGSTGLFLEGKKGEHIKYYAYNKYLRENAMRALGRSITPHAMRHTHASLLLENGVSIDTISRRLGHENSQVTREIYLHVTEKLKEKDNETIAGVKIM